MVFLGSNGDLKHEMTRDGLDLHLDLPDSGLDYKALAKQEAEVDKIGGRCHVVVPPDSEFGDGASVDGPSPSLISLPVPPDGGWGWVVCAGSFLSMIILDGLLFR